MRLGLSKGTIMSDGDLINLNELKKKSPKALAQYAQDLNIDGVGGMRKQDMIFAILQAHTDSGGSVHSEGVLETLPDGFGFLRAPDYNYLPGPDDIYVSPSQIRRMRLRTGDTVSGLIRPPKEGERYYAMLKIKEINFEAPEKAKHKIFFDNLTPLYPTERFVLELEPKEFSWGILDVVVPIG